MPNIKTDPRVLRTKKLIINAFIKLLNEKEFKSITIKDIADEAAVNRATFYYHFTDKYNLMEAVIREDFKERLSSRLKGSNDLNKELIKTVFIVLVTLQEKLFVKYSCKFVSFMDIFERVVKDELYQLFLNLLKEEYSESSQEALSAASTLSSWSIYGGTIQWSKKKTTPLNAYGDQVATYIINGIRGMQEIKVINNAS